VLAFNAPPIPAPPATVKAPVELDVLVVVPVKAKLVPVATPKVGVVKVGLVPNTKAPEPVSSEIADTKFELVGVAKNDATPVPNPLTPEAIGRPEAFVKVAELGVPNAGVIKVGLVFKTTLPVPVAVVVPVPPFTTETTFVVLFII
jgi:hypothetical protein